MKRFVRRLFCRHWWQDQMLIGVGEHERTDIRRCIKCDKSKVLWTGRRKAWRERHGFDTPN